MTNFSELDKNYVKNAGCQTFLLQHSKGGQEASRLALHGVYEDRFKLDFLREASRLDSIHSGYSLSHTKDYGAALIWAEAMAGGIDIEFKSRRIPERVKSQLFHPKDEENELFTWCAKEAIFKALFKIGVQVGFKSWRHLWVGKERALLDGCPDFELKIITLPHPKLMIVICLVNLNLLEY